MKSAMNGRARYTSLAGKEVRQRETHSLAPETDALPGTNQSGQFFITSFLQLRELDLLGSHRFGAYKPPSQQAGSSSSHSSFCEEVFSRVAAVAGVVDPGRGQRPRLQRMRWTAQIFWLLALFRSLSESPSSRLHPRKSRGLAHLGSRIQLQQRNCSRFSRDFLRRSTFPSSQRTGSRSSGLRSPLQEFFRSYPARVAINRRPSSIIEPSAASVTSCSAKA